MNNEVLNKKGGISVETAHIFPVIKKWLYSEKDIFLREIVSNACDAVTKLKRLSSLGQYDSKEESYRVEVLLDKTAKTLTVSDNGIGMTAEELDRYICQIALSGALEFVEKYEGDNKNNGIIGHFGLGFYSSFMVSDTVELITKSYTGSEALHWVCNAEGEYETSLGEREQHGTTVIMHISDDEIAYLEKYKVREILDKYCAFMPVEIYFTDESDEDEAKNALVQFRDNWAKTYPSCVRSWEENWDILSTFFAYPCEVRKIIYTTNIIEGLNRQFRKITKNKPSFTNDDSLRKILYLASQNIVEHWSAVCRNWDMVSDQLRIMFSDREPV